MLTENDIKEELSYAVLHAIAARAGFSCDRPGKDRDSVDALVSARGKVVPDAVLHSPAIGFQLKATPADVAAAPTFSFSLRMKNYNDLRVPRHTPALLAVLVLHEDPAQWITQTEDQLIARRCLYWVQILNYPEVDNEATRVVEVNRQNLLTPDSLKRLMGLASKREEFPHVLP